MQPVRNRKRLLRRKRVFHGHQPNAANPYSPRTCVQLQIPAAPAPEIMRVFALSLREANRRAKAPAVQIRAHAQIVQMLAETDQNLRFGFAFKFQMQIARRFRAEIEDEIAAVARVRVQPAAIFHFLDEAHRKRAPPHSLCRTQALPRAFEPHALRVQASFAQIVQAQQLRRARLHSHRRVSHRLCRAGRAFRRTEITEEAVAQLRGNQRNGAGKIPCVVSANGA